MAPVRKMRGRATASRASSSHDNSSKSKTVPNANLEYSSLLPDHRYAVDTALRSTKRDKRVIRHNALIAKVRDAAISKEKRTVKRRRPGNKMRTSVADLENALPDVDTGMEEDVWEGLSEDESGDAIAEVHPLTGLVQRKNRRDAGRYAARTVKMKSVKPRPGATKRRARMEQGEKDRFARNLANMVQHAPQEVHAARTFPNGDSIPQTRNIEVAGVGADHSARWAALRQFIASSAEKDASFATL